MQQVLIENKKPFNHDDGKRFLDEIIRIFDVKPSTSYVMLGDFPSIQYHSTYFINDINIVVDSKFIAKENNGVYIKVLLYSEYCNVDDLASRIRDIDHVNFK
ncbi:MAG: hypothetical protein AABX19_02755 [Nanoarchaeota archaeon]